MMMWGKLNLVAVERWILLKLAVFSPTRNLPRNTSLNTHDTIKVLDRSNLFLRNVKRKQKWFDGLRPIFADC